ncbi:MAG TPA: hypothetical protein VKB46_19805, partial [Pyrinomonadaceae bacterium]|nr:hypothetical protein [Pyrinomonadaceae bacterium]
MFVPDRDTAEAVLHGGFHEQVQATVADDWAFIWLASLSLPLQVLRFDANGNITREAVFTFASSALQISAGSRIEMAESPNSFIVSGNNGSLTFGGAPIKDQRIELTTGQLKFSAQLNDPSLLPSLRYFYSSPAGPLGAFEYPVFTGETLNQQTITVSARIDPNYPTDATRNQLNLESATSDGSNFLSVAGMTATLEIIPHRSFITQQWDPVQQELYPVPMGDWKLGIEGPGPNGNIDLMCGLSGLEYARVRDGSVVRFVPNSPAYAPNFLKPGTTGNTESLTAQCPDSELPVTTSWMYFADELNAIEDGPEGYYSQPKKGGLFQLEQPDSFMPVLQLQTGGFPPNAQPVFGSPAPSFPMVPYAGVAAGDKPEARLYDRFEVEVLSTTRSNAVFALNQPQGFQTPLDTVGAVDFPGASGPVAVTPQGLLSTFSPDLTEWLQLILATTGDGTTLELQDLNLFLRAALLTNQLFLVITNREVLESWCKVKFPGLTISNWSFALSPETWRDDTVVILKFADRSLRDLINDLSLWSAPGSNLNNGAATQLILQQSVADAEANKDQQEFQYFLNTVLENWNGILFLNSSVPLGDLPEQLRGLAAGIDTNAFKTHHLGVNLSPAQVVDGQIQISGSSLFALIYYEDKDDLVYQGTPYDFKVLSLRAQFANSEIASFSSRIELLVGELFGERSTLEGSLRGDNLVLIGVMQKHEGEESYTFTEQGADTFTITSHVLDTVLITKAQFITLDPSQSQPNEVAARFLLWGSLRFRALEDFDLFSFGPEEVGPTGGLQFSNLIVSMTFKENGVKERSFAFQAGQVVFDPSLSQPRPLSLYARFPVQVTGMVQGDSKTTPADFDFIEVKSPLKAASFDKVWFGLHLTLSLGSQGGLAAKGEFSASLLAAWSPSSGSYNALLAIQLPGSEGGSKKLSIQGPLKLTIGDIEMNYSKAEEAYLMKFGQIALGLFSLKFPPGGRTNLLLFGDPNPQGLNTKLGWYAAYKKDQSKTGPALPAVQHAL